MFPSNRLSALKLSSIVTLIALVLIFCSPLYFRQVNNRKPIFIPVSPFRTPPFTPKTTLSIPEKIWYKLGPRGLTPQARERIETCLSKNPTYRSEFMSDLAGDNYVKEKFSHRPDIVEAFLALQFPILKADFLRYLLLFNEGGIWSDLDVSCEDTPIQDWIPEQYKDNASVVVGWEFDVGWGDNFTRQFTSWIIMARPGSKHMSMVIDDILEGLQEKTKEYSVTIEEMTWSMVGDVVDLTGPRRMTRGILKSLKATLGDEFDEASIGAIYEPKLVGDVLIFPGYSFALSSNHYELNDTQTPVLVTHHYDGSWKNDHLGEMADLVP